MPTIKQLKEKQKSVKSIHKTTSAMEMISTSKSRKALLLNQEFKPFLFETMSIIKTVIENQTTIKEKTYNKTLWLLISSDIGLAGGFNSNIVKEFLREKKPGDEVIAIGKKLHSSLGARNIEHTHYSLAQAKEVGTQDEISMRLMKAYFEDTEIKSVYTKYESQIDFKATIKILLPVTISEDDNLETITNIDFEPSANNILLSMLPLYLSASLNGLIKESEVSEHSARRVAMENATTNGEEIMNDLNVQYNKQRQAKITQEISEIVGGTEALK